MIAAAAEKNDAYGPADYVVLVLDQSYDKYELRKAYRQYQPAESARRKAKRLRNNKLIIQLDERRVARYNGNTFT